MKKEITPLDAWHDFYAWAKSQPFWADLPAKEKVRMYERNAAAKGQRRYMLRTETIRRILLKYAPDRYVFFEGVAIEKNNPLRPNPKNSYNGERR